MSREGRAIQDERDRAVVAAHERLIDALVADLLAASDGEVLASHSPAAGRVAADTLRRRLRRDAPGVAAGARLPGPPPDPPPDPPPGAPPASRHRPERKP